MDATRIECDLSYEPQVSGQRRTLVEQYYHTIDWTDKKQINKVLQVFETILHENEQYILDASDDDWKKNHESIVNKLMWLLEKDGSKWIGKRIVAGTGLPLRT